MSENEMSELEMAWDMYMRSVEPRDLSGWKETWMKLATEEIVRLNKLVDSLAKHRK